MPQRTKRTYKVLIIDDEPIFSNTAEKFLSETYQVITATNGKDGLDKANHELPDLILLDLNMPKMSGFEVCKALRENPNTREIPVIIASGAGDRDSRIEAYTQGADDYITKPFTNKELNAQVKSKIRRIKEARGEDQHITCGNLQIDSSRMEILVDGKSIEASLTEFNLVRYLVLHKDRAIKREEILKEIWKGVAVSSRTIDSHVAALRKKLGAFNYDITSLYGIGYSLKIKD